MSACVTLHLLHQRSFKVLQDQQISKTDAEMLSLFMNFRRDVQRELIRFAYTHDPPAPAPLDGFVLSDHIWRPGANGWGVLVERLLHGELSAELSAQGVDTGVLTLCVIRELEGAAVGPRVGVLRRPSGGEVPSVCFFKLHEHIGGEDGGSVPERVRSFAQDRSSAWPPSGLLEEVLAAAESLGGFEAAPRPGQLRMLAAQSKEGAARFVSHGQIPVEGAPGWEVSATIEPTMDSEWMVMVDRHWAGPASERQPIPPTIMVGLQIAGDSVEVSHSISPEIPTVYWYERRAIGTNPVLFARVDGDSEA